MGDVIAVCGLNREGDLLRQQDVRIIAGGGDAAALARSLADAATGATGIISVGMGGALTEGLQIGDWIIGERLTGAVEAACDARWADALSARFPDARRGRAYADGRLISDPAEKRRLGASGAMVADMESHVAASAAMEAGLPFAILRCISDGIDDAVPPAIGVAMRPDGGLAIGAIIASVVRNPQQLPDLMKSSRTFQNAMAAFAKGIEKVGPRLAFDLR